MTKIYSLVNHKDIQREIIKGFIRSTGIQGEKFTYTPGSKLWIQKYLGFIPGLEKLVLVKCQ